MVGDHAGTAIPGALGDLGLSAEDRGRHIAVDLGIEKLGCALSRRLESPFCWQSYSRLVVDCNRRPNDPSWAAETSDGTVVPGNADLAREKRELRHDEIFEPYHRAIGETLDMREAAGIDTVFVSLHSFTPRMGGTDRPWEIGILHDGREDRFALAMLDFLRRERDLVVGDNEPYKMDETDYTVSRHAYPRSLRYVEIEVRQDLLEREFDRMANLLERALGSATDA